MIKRMANSIWVFVIRDSSFVIESLAHQEFAARASQPCGVATSLKTSPSLVISSTSLMASEGL